VALKGEVLARSAARHLRAQFARSEAVKKSEAADFHGSARIKTTGAVRVGVRQRSCRLTSNQATPGLKMLFSKEATASPSHFKVRFGSVAPQ